MNRQLLLLVLAILPLTTWAYDALVDGIYYNFSGTEATVTYRSFFIKEYRYSGDVTIPATVTYNDVQYKVTGIGTSAFRWCSDLTSIKIPASVTTIDSWAFDDCTGLTSIEIPASVTSIGEYNQEIKGETNVEIIPVIA